MCLVYGVPLTHALVHNISARYVESTDIEPECVEIKISLYSFTKKDTFRQLIERNWSVLEPLIQLLPVAPPKYSKTEGYEILRLRNECVAIDQKSGKVRRITFEKIADFINLSRKRKLTPAMIRTGKTIKETDCYSVMKKYGRLNRKITGFKK